MITFQLVDSTPYRLRYLCFQSGGGEGGLESAILPNVGGPSPDLTTDLASDPSGPLRRIVMASQSAPIGIFGAPLTQAQARAVLNSDDPTGTLLANNATPRAIVTTNCTIRVIDPIEGTTSQPVDFCADVVVVGEDGRPTVRVYSLDTQIGYAYLDIHYRHTVDL